MGKSYLNTIEDIEVSLAIEQLLVADYQQSWAAARVDVASPPTGFVSLGAVVEDSPTMTYSREKFQLQTGIPMVTQFESIQSMEGRFECQLHSNSWRKVQYALGNYTAVASATVVSTVESVVATNHFTLTEAPTSITRWRTYIFGAVEADFDDVDGVESTVTSITSVESLYTIYVEPTPTKTVAADWVVGVYDYVRQVFGGSTIKYYKILGVSDFVNGVQVVHQMFKVSPTDEFTEEFRPDTNSRFPLAFSALGVETIIGSCTELVVGDRYYFPRVTEC
jgi:hypothetical protein